MGPKCATRDSGGIVGVAVEAGIVATARSGTLVAKVCIEGDEEHAIAFTSFEVYRAGAGRAGHARGAWRMRLELRIDRPSGRLVGQTDFVSAPFAGQSGGSFGATGGSDNAGVAAPTAAGAGATATPTRTVQETDLYRLDGNRLYYLNSYRGLMVFDVTNVDQPKFLGRSPIFGTPVDMIVSAGIATVVVGDWYGTLDNGAPFHGSIVRGLDATDPTNIKVIGDAKLGGWVQEDRVVGNVLYAVSEDYGWNYGWGGASWAERSAAWRSRRPRRTGRASSSRR